MEKCWAQTKMCICIISCLTTLWVVLFWFRFIIKFTIVLKRFLINFKHLVHLYTIFQSIHTNDYLNKTSTLKLFANTLSKAAVIFKLCKALISSWSDHNPISLISRWIRLFFWLTITISILSSYQLSINIFENYVSSNTKYASELMCFRV